MFYSLFTTDFNEYWWLKYNYAVTSNAWWSGLYVRWMLGVPANNKRKTLEETGAVFYEHLIYYPTPAHIHYWWGFGSLAGIFLSIQLITGIILVMFYKASIFMAFESIVHLTYDVSYGWLLRYMHANGASFFFIVVYCHMGRGLYYGSFLAPRNWAWVSGVLIFLLMMGAAFIGYVLPWGQMSFWGATVITNLLSAIPVVGDHIVKWIWGGFAVGDATLNRFFSLHYLLPFVIAVLVLVHLFLLHSVGSNNPTGLSAIDDNAKIPFSPYFAVKDVAGFFTAMFLYFFLVFFEPDLLGHPDNYIQANPLVTPAHIVPEWYFLPFYAVLRAIPDKLGGVIGMVGAIIIVAVMSFSPLYKVLYEEAYTRRPLTLLPLCNLLFWLFVADFFLLGWLGGKPAEEPYVFASQLAATFYFSWFVIFPVVYWLENAFYDRAVQLKLK
jgi:quinol-cytochrome oxidoreductase complex cytochrome b subunit